MIAAQPNKQQWGLLPWQGALVGLGVGLLFQVFVGVLWKLSGSPRMGEVLFILFPLVVGGTIALVTPRPIAAIALISGTISVVIFLMVLITVHAEGVLCAILAFPLIFAALGAGVGLGVLLRILIPFPRRLSSNAVIVVLAPALMWGGQRLELKTFPEARTQAVTTITHIAATPDQVWANLQSLDRLAGTKPILMHLGLPVPQRCVLQGTAVGSKRICYFDQGSIEETILEWDPPRRMRLSIDRTNMPGRHWLAFDGAEYVLQPDSTGTMVTRTTTIRSNLAPAWYWARFERWGVSSEHAYLFRDLANRFSEKN